MNAIFMNSKKIKTSDPHILLLNLTDKVSLRRKDMYIYIYCSVKSWYLLYME